MLHLHLAALSPCTVAVWRSKLVPSLLAPPHLSSMVLHCIYLLPQMSWEIPVLPTGGPNLTRCSLSFTRLQTCCVNHPRLRAGKSSPPRRCRLSYQKLRVSAQKYMKEQFSLGNKEKLGGWSLGPAFLCSTKYKAPQLFQLYVPVGKETGFTSIAIILY